MREEMYMPLEEDVIRLKERYDILDTAYSYCYSIDSLDAEGAVNLFTEDCVANYTGDNDVKKGKTAVYEYMSSVFDKVLSQSHYITNARLYYKNQDTVDA